MLIKCLALAAIFVACSVCLTNASEGDKLTKIVNQDKSTTRIDRVTTLLEEIAHLKIDTKPMKALAVGDPVANVTNQRPTKDDNEKQRKYYGRPISACRESLGLATSAYRLLCGRQSIADNFKLNEQYEINPIVRRMWKMTETRTKSEVTGDGIGG